MDTHFHRSVRRNNVHRGISARQRNVETHLCGWKMLCSTYQTLDDSEIRTSSRILRCSYQNADNAKTWWKNWQNQSMDRFVYSLTLITVSSQETVSVCCQQGCRNTGKLTQGSMETCQRNRKPNRYWHKSDVYCRPQGIRMLKLVGMAPDRRRKVAKSLVSSERSWSWASC